MSIRQGRVESDHHPTQTNYEATPAGEAGLRMSYSVNVDGAGVVVEEWYLF